MTPGLCSSKKVTKRTEFSSSYKKKVNEDIGEERLAIHCIYIRPFTSVLAQEKGGSSSSLPFSGVWDWNIERANDFGEVSLELPVEQDTDHWC